jgi:hypothetical protein
MYPTDLDNHTIVSYPQWSGGDSTNGTAWQIRFNSSGTMLMDWTKVDYSTWYANYSGNTNILVNQWVHIAYVKIGTTAYLYINGVLDTSITVPATLASDDGFSANADYGTIGRYSGGQYYAGYIDEFRISKGIARWTESFVPPNKPYSVVDDDFVTDAAGIEDESSVTTVGKDFVVKSDPSEASTDSVFSASAKDGSVLLDVLADGKLQVAGGQNYVEMAQYYLSNGSALLTSNSGYILWANKTDGGTTNNTNVFEIITTGDYGIKVKKPGTVFISFNQDIVTTGTTGYATIAVKKNGTVCAYQLITNTNGQWDCIHIATTVYSDGDDVFTFHLNATDITGLNTSTWSQNCLIWVSLP